MMIEELNVKVIILVKFCNLFKQLNECQRKQIYTGHVIIHQSLILLSKNMIETKINYNIEWDN